MSKNKVVCRNLATASTPQVSDLGFFGPSSTSKRNEEDIKKLQKEIVAIKAKLDSLSQEEEKERVEEEGEKVEMEQLSTEVHSLKARCDAYHEQLQNLLKSTAEAMTELESLTQTNSEEHMRMKNDINKLKEDHIQMGARIQRTENNLQDMQNYINSLSKSASETFQLVHVDMQALANDFGIVYQAMVQHGLLPPPGQHPQLMPPPGQHPQLPPGHLPQIMPPEYPEMMYVKNFNNSDAGQKESRATYKIDLKPLKLKK